MKRLVPLLLASALASTCTQVEKIQVGKPAESDGGVSFGGVAEPGPEDAVVAPEPEPKPEPAPETPPAPDPDVPDVPDVPDAPLPPEPDPVADPDPAPEPEPLPEAPEPEPDPVAKPEPDPDPEPVPAPDVPDPEPDPGPTCLPKCAGKTCGEDGCGGVCGTCTTGDTCVSGKCIDLCGNGKCDFSYAESCVTCPPDCKCLTGAVCLPVGACCIPTCAGKTCGYDGCTDSCGACDPGDVCNSLGSCVVKVADASMAFSPSLPQAGGNVKVTITDTSPWVYVDLHVEGPCGEVLAIPTGVTEVKDDVYQWTYTAGPLTGGDHAFTFTRDQGAVVVVSENLVVGGDTDCSGTKGIICKKKGNLCEDHYPLLKTCKTNGYLAAITCHKFGTCTGVGGTDACSWGFGSYCEDPCGVDAPPGDLPPNRFGIALSGPGNEAELDLALELGGLGSHVHLAFEGITPATTGPDPSWVAAIHEVNVRALVPVVRLGPPPSDPGIRDMADDASHKEYTKLAAAYRKVVEGLPKQDGIPLYVQIHEEPNLCDGWVCSGDGQIAAFTMAAEYALFYEDVAAAIHAIGDDEILVAPAAVAMAGAAKCECCGSLGCTFTPGETGLDFLAKMKAAVPKVFEGADFIASHSYPAKGIGWGLFVPFGQATAGLEFFKQELEVLGPSLPVLITATGWSTWRPIDGPYPSPEQIAAWTQLAFEEIWLLHPRIAGVMPFVLQDPVWGDQEGFGWVHTSGAPEPVYLSIKSLRESLGL